MPTSASLLPGLLMVGVAPLADTSEPLTSIDLYGLRDVYASDVRAAIGHEVGARLSEGTDAIHARVAAIDGIAEVDVRLVTHRDSVALFVGVREDGSPQQAYRARPAGKAVLALDVLERYADGIEPLLPAILAGESALEANNGYALSSYAPLRDIQVSYVGYADDRFDELASVLHTSADAKARGAAATILGYASDKQAAWDELYRAAGDPNAEVRAHAARALGLLVDYDYRHPEIELETGYAVFLDMLESAVWTDRMKAAAALDMLTRSRDEALLKDLAKRSLDELEEMARWNSGRHSVFALRTLARVAGEDESRMVKRIDALRDKRMKRLRWVDKLAAKSRSAGP